MAVTVSGTSITFNDATVQTTAGGAVNTTTVLAATAGASAGAVGTYCFARSAAGSNIAFGSTIAGSSLRPQSAAYGFAINQAANNGFFTDGAAQTGTWRAMGTYTYSFTAGCGNDWRGATLWLRIS